MTSLTNVVPTMNAAVVKSEGVGTRGKSFWRQ